MALSVLSLNCNGIRDQSKRSGLVQWLRSLPFTVDVVCLQETHCVSSADCALWFASSGFSSCVSPGSSHSCGCAVLYRPTLSLVDSWSDVDGRFLHVQFSLCDKSFRVCCIYAPNGSPEGDQFFEYISDSVDPSIRTLLVGDLNTVFDRTIDRRGSDAFSTNRESSARLAALFDACCVTNIWRYLHPDTSGFTWTKWDGSMASRTDLCGVPYVWVSSVSSCDVVPCPFSDHCAVLLSLSIPHAVPPGPGLWKLNCSILSESAYCDLIAATWRSWRSSIPSPPISCQVVGGGEKSPQGSHY